MDSKFTFVAMLLIVSLTAGDDTLNKDIRYRVLSDETLSSIGSFYNVHTTLNQFGRNKRQNEININTTTIFDHHRYYTSRYIPRGDAANDLWFELNNLIGSGAELQTNVTESDLQGLHRYFQPWTLKFNFPFYGHFINTLAVTTGGFLYMSDFLHEQVHLTQFVAPLQADFNPSINDTAKIFVYNTIERFTVQWDQVHNHDHVRDGPFTFQVSLFPNGTIVFVYREIPLRVNELNNSDHPVEVGLADALYVDIIVGNFILRNIYEYSRIQLNATNDLAYSAYIITPVPNCVIANDCNQCIAITEEGNFDCSWCPDIERCSDGLDRLTQEWFIAGCDEDAVDNCAIPPTHTTLSSFTSTFTQTTLDSSTHTTLSSFTSTFIQTTLDSSTHTTLSSFTSMFTQTTLDSSTHTTLSSFTSTFTQTTLDSSTHTTLSSFSSTFIHTIIDLSTTVTSSIHTTSAIQPSSSSFTSTSAIQSSSSFFTSTPAPSPEVDALSSGAIAGISVAILLIIFVLLASIIVIVVLMYAYKKPTSRLGLFMIEHRPNAWSLNKSKTYEVKGEKVLLEDKL